MEGDARRVERIEKREAVGWFSPASLFQTGRNALVTAVLGERTGRREILAALDRPPGPQAPGLALRADGYYDHRDEAEEQGGVLWIDYLADLGDGFNATHSIAWLVGRDHVFLNPDGTPLPQPMPPAVDQEVSAETAGPGRVALPAGRILVLGGDETYPYASQDNYLARTVGPYFAARPWGSVDPGARTSEGRRFLYAIPGNHDWYDGLGSFVRQFCQPGRWIGCWQVQQRRSYFSLRLPHGYWLWGLDTATDGDIDPPQLAYFQQQAALIGEGDQLILAVRTPPGSTAGPLAQAP